MAELFCSAFDLSIAVSPRCPTSCFTTPYFFPVQRLCLLREHPHVVMYRQPSQPANKGTIEVEDAAFLFAVRNCLSEPIAHGASGRNFSTLNRLASSTFRQEPVMSSLRIFRANAFFFFLVLILLVGSQQIARSQSIGGG